MARPILQLQATEEEVLELGRLVRGTKVSVGDRFRAQNYPASTGGEVRNRGSKNAWMQYGSGL